MTATQRITSAAATVSTDDAYHSNPTSRSAGSSAPRIHRDRRWNNAPPSVWHSSHDSPKPRGENRGPIASESMRKLTNRRDSFGKYSDDRR